MNRRQPVNELFITKREQMIPHGNVALSDHLMVQAFCDEIPYLKATHCGSTLEDVWPRSGLRRFRLASFEHVRNRR